MAATFEALGDFLDDYLELPVLCKDGQTRLFRVPSPPAEDGLRVETITKAAATLYQNGTEPDQELLDDREERTLFALVLGDVHDEILTEVTWTRFRHVALTAMVWILNDRDAAAKFWSSGGDPSRWSRPASACPTAASRCTSRAGSRPGCCAPTAAAPW